jgi:hypothetical protein
LRSDCIAYAQRSQSNSKNTKRFKAIRKRLESDQKPIALRSQRE